MAPMRGVFRGGVKGARAPQILSGNCPPPRILKEGKKKGREKREERGKGERKRGIKARIAMYKNKGEKINDLKFIMLWVMIMFLSNNARPSKMVRIS